MFYIDIGINICCVVILTYFFNKLHLNILNTLKACNELTSKEIDLLHDMLLSLENNVGKRIDAVEKKFEGRI